MSGERRDLPEDSGQSDGRLVPANSVPPALRDPYGQFDPYRSPVPEASDFSIDILEYWHILYKRKSLIAGIVAAALALGAVWSLMQTPLYTAKVRIQIDREAVKVIEGGNVTSNDRVTTSEYLLTQYRLLESRSMAERVASSLGLIKDESFVSPNGASVVSRLKNFFKPAEPSGDGMQAETAGVPERVVVARVLAGRRIQPVQRSQLVDILYTDANAGRARRIANAYAKEFIAANLDKRFQANSYAKTFLEDQIKQLKLRLQLSEKTLVEFAEKEQIVATSEKTSIAESNLASANAALGVLVSERIKNEQLWKQAEASNGSELPQSLTNGAIDALRAQKNVLLTEYREKLRTFKPAYPAMVDIQNKVKEIERQIKDEQKTIQRSLKASYDSSSNQEKQMRKQIEELRADFLALQRRSIQYNILKREVDTNRSLYNDLLQRYKEVDVAGGVGANNVFVVDEAEVPQSPSSPKVMRALVLSFALGLSLGAASALLLERLDDTVCSVEEFERVTGLTTLGLIPKVDTDSAIEDVLRDPRSALAEAYRSVATSLQFSTERGMPNSISITSSGPSEGKSITSIALARHFAVMGLKVLLIDGDLRKPSLHRRLGMDNSVGLSNVLTGGAMPPEVMQATDIDTLAFMASGPLPPNAADLLSGPAFYSLTSNGLQVFNLIVVDGPPVMGLADAQLLANTVEATVFVAAAGQARGGQIRGAVRRLQLSRSPLIGAVLTKFDAKKGGGYGYGYGYGDEAYTYGGPPVEDDDAHLDQLSARRKERA